MSTAKNPGFLFIAPSFLAGLMAFTGCAAQLDSSTGDDPSDADDQDDSDDDDTGGGAAVLFAQWTPCDATSVNTGTESYTFSKGSSDAQGTYQQAYTSMISGQLTVMADGKLDLIGTYADDGFFHHQVGTYALDGRTLVLGGLRADGAHDGLVGTWEGRWQIGEGASAAETNSNGFVTTQRWTFNADGTGKYSVVDGSSFTAMGTWQALPETGHFRFLDEDSNPTDLVMVGDGIAVIDSAIQDRFCR